MTLPINLASPLRLKPSAVTPNPNPNPKPHPSSNKNLMSAGKAKSSAAKYAILGAGFAGLSVAWHLLKHYPNKSQICVDIYDEVGIGGGASGASGGLLHPYSPKAKVLWRGADCWNECLKLVTVAESAEQACGKERIVHDSSGCSDGPIILRKGILRPATAEKNVEILKQNARNYLQNCSLEVLNGDAAHCLVPNLVVPFDSAIYMPLALNIHPRRYLQAFYIACLNAAEDLSASHSEQKEINLHIRSINSLCELAVCFLFLCNYEIT